MKRYRQPISNYYEAKKKKTRQSKPVKSPEKNTRPISIYQHFTKHPS